MIDKNNEVQWLEKYEKEDLFAIQIGQEYNSLTYGDKGYLFLLVDMIDHDSPQIKIRTWQPNRDPNINGNFSKSDPYYGLIYGGNFD